MSNMSVWEPLWLQRSERIHKIVTKLANDIHFMLPWGVERGRSRTHWQPPIWTSVYAYSMGLRGAEILSGA